MLPPFGIDNKDSERPQGAEEGIAELPTSVPGSLPTFGRVVNKKPRF
jgi:hypothetical protein